MIDHDQYRHCILLPVLAHLGLGGTTPERLMTLTFATESDGGRYLKQLGQGPAIGGYQMEPFTHDDLWETYLNRKPELSRRIRQLELPDFLGQRGAAEMAGNLYYATAMARVRYWRVAERLPDPDDIVGIAGYWKRHYNTHLGKGEVDKAVQAYHRFVA